MSSTIQSSDPREKLLLQMQLATSELYDKFYKAEPLTEESFKRIEDIFEDLDNLNTNLATANKHFAHEWFKNKKAKRISVCILGSGIFLAWLNPILDGIVSYLQNPNSQVCTFQSTNANNSTITVYQTSDYDNNLQIGIIVSSVVVAILISINTIFGECNRRIIDDYEHEKSELALRSNLNSDLRIYFKEFKEFVKKNDRNNFNICIHKLNEIARNELLKEKGSKEKMISHFLRRVDDPDLKEELQQLKEEIRMDINSQKPPRRSSTRKRTRKSGKFERGDFAEDSVRRGSITYLTDHTKDSIRSFVTNLGLGFRLDRLQIGDWWISENGAVSRKEADTPDLNHEDSVAVTAPLEVDLV